MTSDSTPQQERLDRLARLRERRGATSTDASDSSPSAVGSTSTTSPAAPAAGAGWATPDVTATAEIPVVESAAGRGSAAAAGGPTRTARRHRPVRRSPASTAKIVTVGASTTALLGMMAGYGIADRAAAADADADADAASDAVAPATDAATLPAPAAPTTPPSTEPPRVIVVVVDAATGRPISQLDPDQLDAALAGEAAPSSGAASSDVPAGEVAGALSEGTVPATQTIPTETTGAPAPVQPTVVDLAVPAAPAPAPVPAPRAHAPAAAPAPAPAPAPSGGSGGS